MKCSKKKIFIGVNLKIFIKNLEDQSTQLKTYEKGEIFSYSNIKLLRPLNGLGKYFNKLINKKAPFNIEKLL